MGGWALVGARRCGRDIRQLERCRVKGRSTGADAECSAVHCTNTDWCALNDEITSPAPPERPVVPGGIPWRHSLRGSRDRPDHAVHIAPSARATSTLATPLPARLVGDDPNIGDDPNNRVLPSRPVSGFAGELVPQKGAHAPSGDATASCAPGPPALCRAGCCSRPRTERPSPVVEAARPRPRTTK